MTDKHSTIMIIAILLMAGVLALLRGKLTRIRGGVMWVAGPTESLRAREELDQWQP